MVAAIFIVIIRILVGSFGTLAQLCFRRPPIQDEEIQTFFFRGGENFRWIMSAITKTQESIFGPGTLRAAVKLNIVQYIFFLFALGWFLIWLPGPDLLRGFVAGGLTINLDATERDYIIKNWHDWLANELLDDGNKLYVGDALIQILILTGILVVIFSASVTASILNAFRTIRGLARRRMGLLPTCARLTAAALVSFAFDLIGVFVLLAVLIVFGRSDGLRLQEQFKASVEEGYLGYGAAITIGDRKRGDTEIGNMLRVYGMDFDELRREVKHTRWPELIFVGAGYEFAIAGPLACGHNMWSELKAGEGAREAIKIVLPFFMGLAALVLSRALLIPAIMGTLVVDRLTVWIGKRATLSSFEGYSELSKHAAVLLSIPPVIAAFMVLLFWRLC